MTSTKQHENIMRLALEEAASALQAGDFPVGCVLADGEEVIARGRRLNSGGENANELDHAEIVTIRDLLRQNPQYDMSRVTVYSTMEPCLMCYTTLLLSGVRNFIWAYEDIMGGGTSLALERLAPLYAEMKVSITPRILRMESLRLFQDFFRSHSYWADSTLARYTLEQSLGGKNG